MTANYPNVATFDRTRCLLLTLNRSWGLLVGAAANLALQLTCISEATSRLSKDCFSKGLLTKDRKSRLHGRRCSHEFGNTLPSRATQMTLHGLALTSSIACLWLDVRSACNHPNIFGLQAGLRLLHAYNARIEMKCRYRTGQASFAIFGSSKNTCKACILNRHK